jgi:tetratricopeptide (TPR) repeat protein
MTATMAELYLKQGLYEEAIRVYERLLESSPGDFRLVEKLKAARLLSERGPAISRQAAQSPARPPAPSEEASGPQPEEQATADDDIAPEVEVADAPPAPQPGGELEARRQTIRAYLESLLDAAGAQEGGLDPEASPRFEAWLQERDEEHEGE